MPLPAPFHRGLAVFLLCASVPAFGQFKFAVSGDSRNCGDIVMPAIAADALRNGAQFYLHLGDLRDMGSPDADMTSRFIPKTYTLAEYQKLAWQDFIDYQIASWGRTPFYVGIGNHELVPPKTRGDFIAQFADWLNSPTIHEQRSRDRANDHLVRTYFHWIQSGVDFIYLDNASQDQFDFDQVRWFEEVLEGATKNTEVKTVVVGMHAALPDSQAAGHSMNDWPQGLSSGKRVYGDLVKFRADTKKHVYVLASHSHFYFPNVFNTDGRKAGGETVLPGWIIGTAGAFRYKLPPTAVQEPAAKTNVYGYLLATVSPAGEITFDFHELKEDDVPAEVVSKMTRALVRQCFIGNHQE